MPYGRGFHVVGEYFQVFDFDGIEFWVKILNIIDFAIWTEWAFIGHLSQKPKIFPI